MREIKLAVVYRFAKYLIKLLYFEMLIPVEKIIWVYVIINLKSIYEIVNL